MIRLEDGTVMADTEEQIKRMFRMAKRLYQTHGREAVLDPEDEEDRAYVKTILEERSVAGYRKDKTVFDEDTICLTGISRCESDSVLSVGAKARTETLEDLLAFHILVFTYNDDGILKPVGISQTVSGDGEARQLDNLCRIRKVNIQSRAIGAMMTFIKTKDTYVAAKAKIELPEGEMERQYLALRDW